MSYSGEKDITSEYFIFLKILIYKQVCRKNVPNIKNI